MDVLKTLKYIQVNDFLKKLITFYFCLPHAVLSKKLTEKKNLKCDEDCICFINQLKKIWLKCGFPFLKGRSRRLRPKAHILDDPLGNPYDGLKVLFGPPYGP